MYAGVPVMPPQSADVLSPSRIAGYLTNAEVAQQYSVLISEKHVFRLDVPVYNAFAVYRSHSVA